MLFGLRGWLSLIKPLGIAYKYGYIGGMVNSILYNQIQGAQGKTRQWGRMGSMFSRLKIGISNHNGQHLKVYLLEYTPYVSRCSFRLPITKVLGTPLGNIFYRIVNVHWIYVEGYINSLEI